MIKLQYNTFHTINEIFCAVQHRYRSILILNTNENLKLMKYFFKLGLILDYSIKLSKIEVIFNSNFFQLMHSYQFISKPSKRVYYSYKKLSKNFRYQTVFGLVSTKYGYLSIIECLKYRIGGELIFLMK